MKQCIKSCATIAPVSGSLRLTTSDSGVLVRSRVEGGYSLGMENAMTGGYSVGVECAPCPAPAGTSAAAAAARRRASWSHAMVDQHGRAPDDVTFADALGMPANPAGHGHLGGLLSGRLGDNRYQVRRTRATRPTRRRLKLPRPRQTLHHRRATPQTIAARVAIPNAKLRSAAAPSASANALLRSVATPCACSGITRNASGEASSECRAVPKPYRARTISRNCATSKPRTARSSKGW